MAFYARAHLCLGSLKLLVVFMSCRMITIEFYASYIIVIPTVFLSGEVKLLRPSVSLLPVLMGGFAQCDMIRSMSRTLLWNASLSL